MRHSMIVRVPSIRDGYVDVDGRQLEASIAVVADLASRNEDRVERGVQALNHYARQYGDLIAGRRQPTDREFALPSAFPTNSPANSTVLATTGDRLSVDMSWTQIFQVEDFRNTNEESFDIADVYDAVSFEEIPSGSSVKLRGITGAKTNYKFLRYGGGFQYDIDWLRDNKFWRVANGLAAMQARYGAKQAIIAYATITAAGITDQPRDISGTAEVDDDVKTINAAATAILNAIYTDTDADGNTIDEEIANPRFILLYNAYTAGYAERVAKIMSANYGASTTNLSETQLAFPVQPIGSPSVPTGKFYLALPGRKFVAGIRQDLELHEDLDIYKYVGANLGYGRFRMVRGDSNQVRGIPLA